MAAALFCPALAGAQGTGETSVILGRVTDRSTGHAVRDASVGLEGADRAGVTDATGQFEFPAVPPGTYVLTVTRIGYEAVADTVAVPEASQVDLQVELVPTAVELEPLVVVASFPMGRKLAGFHRRRQAAATGYYLTRADFQERPAVSVSGMLRRVPGVRVVPDRRGLTAGSHVVMRANCRPTVYIDGVRIRPGGLTIDEMLAPPDIEGVEVYRGGHAPPEFTSRGCGTILFWTRPGGRPDGGLPFWKAALFAGGFTALAVLLTAIL